MSDLSWCTHCDNAISQFSESLYCSEECLRSDALRNHPLLGYTYPEFVDFPRPYPKQQQQHQSNSYYVTSSSSSSSSSLSPAKSSALLSSSSSLASSSSDSIHTLPTLSTSHSTCQSSPALSACDAPNTTPPLLSLPSVVPTMGKQSSLSSTSSSAYKSSCSSKSSSANQGKPAFLLVGATTATTALSRPFLADYRATHW